MAGRRRVLLISAVCALCALYGALTLGFGLCVALQVKTADGEAVWVKYSNLERAAYNPVVEGARVYVIGMKARSDLNGLTAEVTRPERVEGAYHRGAHALTRLPARCEEPERD